ncbi:MAG: xanthine dehydrogenase family protein molybdopterin-binding subunit [Rhodobacteraceae bacterium]|nr:xanthine dehydrogenase family protein molybdopterin-binding subunit [Paracoccaceae bacterium]
MGAFGRSQSIRRLEDLRFLAGRGRYVDDIAPAGALHLHVLRAPVAHARIVRLDAALARAMPGVRLVVTAAELAAWKVKPGMRAVTVRNRDGSEARAPFRPALAADRVRFVGEAVAAIVAESLDAARDAAERVAVDYAELPVKLDLAPGGADLHESLAGNVGYDWALGEEATVAAALAAAAQRVRLVVEDNRIIVNAMEPRAAFAEWDGRRLHFCFNGQGVWGQKAALADALGLAEAAVRVTTPDVGGGFGMKATTYPEYVVIAAAARHLGRAVRWSAERAESMLSDNAGRDLVSEAEIGFDAGFRITGYRVRIRSNLGAYASQFGQMIQTEIASKVATGVYDIPALRLEATGIHTNTTPTDAYRGAGRPEANYTLERTLDTAARQLGIDPWELRRRNFVTTFPWRSPVGEIYDTGDFHRVLDRLHAEADAAGLPARRAAARGRGRLLGLGVASYIEAILGDPTEGAKVAFGDDGTVSLFVGTQSNGQGHETVYAQFLSDRTGIPVGRIRIVQGDSDLVATGGGTGGSRSVTVQGAAILAVVDTVVAAMAPFLAAEFGVTADAVRFADGAFRAQGTNRALTMLEAAGLARARGRSGLLAHAATTRLPGRSYPNGAHAAEVEVDPETGGITLLRYTVVDDFGNVLHPLLVEGQVQGGVVQGLGQALSERVVHDAAGQLLTATFMDYGLPRAADLPFLRLFAEPVPSTSNPLGMKGCGEAGTVGALAAVGNAVLDALWPEGVRRADMPFTPERVWGWLRAARGEG